MAEAPLPPEKRVQRTGHDFLKGCPNKRNRPETRPGAALIVQRPHHAHHGPGHKGGPGAHEDPPTPVIPENWETKADHMGKLSFSPGR
ncbi:MAG: hypothetical protein QF751_06015 [Alphaproteobacteria bacterium]|jgi:hypothetical protein|nr:hypothetical protein [Alphaproteobacteria bacterium]